MNRPTRDTGPVLAGQAANSDWDPQATTWHPLTHD